ncbi:MAG: FAD-binding oxidoreductase [Cohaesibacter sp.]|nr:FAD-binding oxidoreductase [Cohaesibacter sp.]
MTDILNALMQVLDEGEILRTEQDIASYRKDEACCFQAPDLIVLRPATTNKVSKIMEIFYRKGQAITTRGGGTGLAGGSVPDHPERAFILSTERLNKIRSVDPIANIMVAEAGVPLQRAKDQAAKYGRDIAISHGAVGSSTIGGNISTNAGGINVIRYGMTREQVIGVEAVLADGHIINAGMKLEKNNIGYDLGRMMIGAEGTLGIITAVTLKMRAQQTHHVTALVACASVEDTMGMLKLMRDHMGDDLSAFEVMSRSAILFCCDYTEVKLPNLNSSSPWMVLIEASSGRSDEALEVSFNAAIEKAFEEEIIHDGVIAQSEAQRHSLWALRDGIAEAFSGYNRPFMRTDMAVPVSKIPDFIHRLETDFTRACPEAILIAFGHAGDGNIHINLIAPPDGNDHVFASKIPKFALSAEMIALELEGTVSAEHGIGRTKRDALKRMISPQEFALMQALKRSFDPKLILNPGAILQDASSIERS